jgi:hypothetical protein
MRHLVTELRNSLKQDSTKDNDAKCGGAKGVALPLPPKGGGGANGCGAAGSGTNAVKALREEE